MYGEQVRIDPGTACAWRLPVSVQAVSGAPCARAVPGLCQGLGPFARGPVTLRGDERDVTVPDDEAHPLSDEFDLTCEIAIAADRTTADRREPATIDRAPFRGRPSSSRPYPCGLPVGAGFNRWSGRQDSNLRPRAPKARALPG